MRVVVVGAGLGGLSAACHLAGRGHEVVVVERAAAPGGRAGRLSSSGYRFDTGPTVLTMVDILAEPFAAAGTRWQDHLTLHRLDPAYRASYADGSELAVRAQRADMAAEIATVCGADEAAAFERFADWLAQLYQVEQPNFIDRNYNSPLDLVTAPRELAALVRLGGLRRLQRIVDQAFTDDRLRRLFSFQALYAGLSPFEALGLYAVIAYMDVVAGVWFPEGGMHAVATALAAAAERAGVELRYEAPVTVVERGPDGHAQGVRLADGEVVRADAVVLNPDLPVAYRTLTDVEPPRVARRGQHSPSCVLWLAGVRGELPAGTQHHNIHFGEAWRSAFDELIDEGRLMSDPSLLISVPSRSDPSLAPAGGHVLYVLEPTPNLDGNVDWLAEEAGLEDRLRKHLGRLGYPTDIEVCHTTDPRAWRDQGMERGTPFALAHRFFQSGPFRPNNVDRRLPGVVHVGSGTVPGVGVPMVLLSGRLAADRVDELAASRSSRRPRWRPGAGRQMRG